MDEPSTLYRRLGEETAVMAAVQISYQKVLADPRVNHFFEKLDMEQQTKKQLAFMSWAFGGPEEYKGRPLREAHRNLLADGLSDAHFDAIAEHLGSTLDELHVSEDLKAEVLGIIESTRDDVLNR